MFKKVLLLVEDDEFLREIMARRLSMEELFEVIQARNGKQGIEELHKNKIDLVLLDLMMPEVDGVSFLQQMRQNDFYQDIPVIVLSNLSDQEKIDQCAALGITDYLIKANFTPNELFSKVKEILEDYEKKMLNKDDI